MVIRELNPLLYFALKGRVISRKIIIFTFFFFSSTIIGSVFQFGSSTTNFNFTNNNPSGVFKFGANPSTPAAPAQPSGSGGFPFNQPSASFTVG